MARQIKLTRDERIALNEAIEGGGVFSAISSAIPSYKVDQLVIKLQHRGLLDNTSITELGRLAMAASRQTKPKAAI